MGVLYLLSEGSAASKSGPRIAVEKDGCVIGRLPIRSIDGVVVGKNAQVSTQIIFELVEQNIPIFYIDERGKIIAHFCNEKQSANRLLRQLEIFSDSVKQVELSQEIVAEKIWNQYQLLRQYAKSKSGEKLSNAIQKLKKQSEKVKNLKTVEEIRGAEGLAAKNYFSAFPEIIDQNRWKWKGRSQHPAKDPLNALLNYGYAFLEREVRVAVAISGMDARFGFFHSNDGRKDSLIYDLMELFRQPVIDRLILNLVNRKMIQPENFVTTKEDCRLEFEALRTWCTRYEEHMARNYQEYEGNLRDMITARVKEFSTHINR